MYRDFLHRASFIVDGFKPGPIRHLDLPSVLLEVIEGVYRDAGHFVCSKLEEFERYFMRDMYPLREAFVWRGIADAFRLYCDRHLRVQQLSDEEGAALVKTLIGISMGNHREPGLRRLTKVDKHVVCRLLVCWLCIIDSRTKACSR